jgi:putative two-component system response regulator
MGTRAMHTELEKQVVNLPKRFVAVCDEETEGLLFALAQAVEQRDRQTAGHCERLAFISVAIGMAMRLDSASLLALYRGGFLHDVGKVGIPDSILFKPAGLTAEEWIVMRSHSARGEEICRHLKSLAPVLPIIRHHHERWDGTGYPDGLSDSQIPLLARVLQVADIYDALTSLRPYKPAYLADEALQIIEEETSRGWRDPEVVQMFLRVHKSIIEKIGYYNSRPDCNLVALQNSLTDLHSVMDAVA